MDVWHTYAYRCSAIVFRFAEQSVSLAFEGSLRGAVFDFCVPPKLGVVSKLRVIRVLGLGPIALILR